MNCQFNILEFIQQRSHHDTTQINEVCETNFFFSNCDYFFLIVIKNFYCHR